MPRAPKPCNHDGCTERVRGRRYCDQHKPTGWAKGPSRTATPEHRAWRTAVLARDRGSCQIKGPRCTGRATEADHVIPVARGGAELDTDNGQAACTTCHRVKTLREATEGRRLAAQQAARGPTR